MKTLFMALVLVSSVAYADKYLHPTFPATDMRDYDKPSLIIKDDGTIGQTFPGTEVEDYEKGGYIRDDDDSDDSFFEDGSNWED